MSRNRTCYMCRFFHVTMADPGYSEWTPGSNWAMVCMKNVWRYDAYNDDTEEFGKKLETAEACKLFVAREQGQ